MILTALNNRSLELKYSEHLCDCADRLSPEVEAFVEELLFAQYDTHETKLPALHSL